MDDITRVSRLARRVDADVEKVSKRFRKNDGVVLRQAQATALQELSDLKGLFAPMRVGSGKTLVSLLAHNAVGAEKSVLIVPASLRDKTKRDYKALRDDWRVVLPTLLSYEELGRVQHAEKLNRLRPDLLILDEAHKARNGRAACTRRIKRYIVENPDCVVVCLSGTLMTDFLMDYHHLTTWALRDSAPVPIRPADAERWALALDKDVGIFQRERAADLSALSGGFHEHFRGSRGVVPTPGTDCEASILLSRWSPKIPTALQEIINDVELTSERPDGEMLDEWELPECLCQLALGFYYRWDPAPPEWWLTPRRAWRSYVQGVLDAHLDGFDSEMQIAVALDNQDGDTKQPPNCGQGLAKLSAWRKVRKKFEPNAVPVWLTDEVMHQVVRFSEKGTLIWVKQIAAGEKLAELGVPYYGAGANPEGAPPGQTMALSIAAHGTGVNLQHHWSKNLVLHPPANADAWEQMVGRTHRLGQKADEIVVRVISAIDYHRSVMRRVRAEARRLTDASGFSYKISLATSVDE